MDRFEEGARVRSDIPDEPDPTTTCTATQV